MNQSAGVRLEGLGKRFANGTVALHALDLEVQRGEFMVLVGPSGCGKSTTLRIIAGLEDPSSGQVRIGDEVVTDKPPAERGVAMVFQSYALYPHMSVAQNISFGLRMGGLPAAQVAERVNRVARSLQLEALLERRPRELSGGQRQRVAIGRAIAREPRVFLFDEPLSNLDAALRTQMRAELGALHQRLGATIVYVTHDQVEAMTLGQRIAVFNAGRIEQVGTPTELYQRPGTLFVAGFLGSPRMNLLPAAQASVFGHAAAGAGHVGVRPEHLQWSDSPQGAGAATVVERCEYLGDALLVHLRVPQLEELLVAKVEETRRPWPTPGQTLWLTVAAAHLHTFDAGGLRSDREAGSLLS